MLLRWRAGHTTASRRGVPPTIESLMEVNTMRRVLSLLVVLGLLTSALLGFAPASAHATDLASVAAPAPTGTDAILPPIGDPAWHWWWGRWPSAPWACTFDLAEHLPRSALVGLVA